MSEPGAEQAKDGDSKLLHLAAIGRVASTWSVLEGLIDSAALRLANFDWELGFCFTAQVIGPGKKLDAYIAVAKHRGAKADFDRFAKDTTALSERRNRVIHDQWDLEGIPRRLEITARKKLKVEFRTVPTSEVNKLVGDIIAHAENFIALDDQILAELAASPPTPPAPKTKGTISVSRSTRCEARQESGQWEEVSVEEAIAVGSAVEKRCIECHGPVRAHGSREGVPSPHIEHRQRHSGCSLGDCFSGHHSIHPHALD